MSKLLTDKQISVMYGGLTVAQLRKWRQRRVGPPYIKLGRSIFYTQEDVEKWLKLTVVKIVPKNGLI